MRKLIISILLASAVAAPAFADPNDDARQAAKAERQQAREERQQARDNRPAKVDPAPAARQQQHFTQQPQPQPQQQVARPQRFDQQQQPARQFQSDDRAARIQQRDADRAARDAARNARQAQPSQVFDQRRDRVRDQIGQPGRVTRPPVVSNTPRPGTQPPAPTTRQPSRTTNWNTNWRQNNRYDWRNWRDRHRNRFHLGFYYDPFGWGYSPYQIGWRLWPSYYGSRYWISDPWQYRLPYAPPGTQWVRYYNDALLVDTWSGQVVDVIYNFFW